MTHLRNAVAVEESIIQTKVFRMNQLSTGQQLQLRAAGSILCSKRREREDTRCGKLEETGARLEVLTDLCRAMHSRQMVDWSISQRNATKMTQLHPHTSLVRRRYLQGVRAGIMGLATIQCS